ncbi:MAG: patatin-like phospholipase family protein [Methylobacteriaceae bacterium]|nr:patatin-like phospholipase family protein [Methylobacteriaceae bacterium]
MSETPQRKRVNLALQGGGAHGAFTWGVLDAFLEDGRLDVVAISGTSAGAMNAVAFADGLREGGVRGARSQLERFWKGASVDGTLSEDQRKAIGLALGFWDPFKVRDSWAEALADNFSPYDLNPLDINQLRDVVGREIDFRAVRESDGPKLFIAATNVYTGKVRIFRRPELTIDMLMASACLPTVFKAVEIEGVPYWDGGYMGNPVLFPFFTETDCDDVILIQINPIERRETPHNLRDILSRLDEITFNAPLLQEFRAIDFVARLIEAGRLDSTHYKQIRMHLVASEKLMKFGARSRMDADYDFFRELFAIGRDAGSDFLKTNFDAIGAYATLNLKEQLN